jgi:hypothetical protein
VILVILQSCSIQKTCVVGVNLILGFAVVSCIVFLPFAGDISLFLDSVFIAPLSYSQAKLSVWQVLTSQWEKGGELFRSAYILSLCALVVLLIEWKKRKPVSDSVIVIVALLAVEMSIAIGGRDFHHYWIQLAPLLGLLSAYAMSRVSSVSIWSERTLLVGIYIAFIGLVLASQQVAKGFRQHDDLPKVLAYLEQRIQPNETLYTTNQHILYWLLNKEPLSSAVLHPSNLTKPFLLQHMPNVSAQPAEELQRILSLEPTWILTQKGLFYWKSIAGLENFLDDILAKHYQLQTTVGKTRIHKRIELGKHNVFNNDN